MKPIRIFLLNKMRGIAHNLDLYHSWCFNLLAILNPRNIQGVLKTNSPIEEVLLSEV